jgi:LPS-assembly protein
LGTRTASGGKSVRAARLYGATALASLFAFALVPQVAVVAQPIERLAPEVSDGSQMLLEADTLVYDNDLQTVTAIGGVQIDYAGNRIVAQRVSYNQRTGRLMASGNVEIIERDGNRISADQIDITDDFRDGFVNALRVETPDRTFFGAESAERREGRITTFRNGVYTACEPCEEQPEKAPIWRIKARKIIWNGEAKTVRFENARFEFFGFPIAQLPFFEIADPTVERKTGFLMPRVKYKSDLGVGIAVPFYIALAPTYDLTLTGTGYTKQGFLGEAEWRQQFDNGKYNLKIAGIRQNDPEEFRDENGRYNVDSGRPGDLNYNRGMIGTKGEFKINPRWTFGWDVLVQSDKDFSRTYDIEGFDDYYRASEIYLIGLNERNYFDLRFQRFQVQESALDERVSDNPAIDGTPNFNARHPQQPWVLPSFDYAYTPDEPVAGGELNIDMNAQVIHRDELDEGRRNRDGDLIYPMLRGIEGTHGRFTAEAEWKRSLMTGGGLVFTPLLHARGDAIGTDLHPSADAAILDHATLISGRAYSHDDDLTYGSVEAEIRSAYYRAMATAGLETRWPILFSTTSSSHILEPMAQIFVRPDAPHQDVLGIPNEDAQSLVFDATSLFERDKFSGYDRIEGGTRANLGIRYSGSFANGWSASGVFGQSYHLAGENPYAQPDLVNAGAYSGLETDVSDFVGMVGLTSPGGLAVSAGARFDEETFDVRRTDVQAGLIGQPLSFTTRYTFIDAQPLYGFAEDRHEVSVGAVARLAENWSTFGASTYDFQSETLVRSSFGFSYDDECFTYAMTYSQRRAPDSDEVKRNIGFNISFRTLGDIGTATNVLQ